MKNLILIGVLVLTASITQAISVSDLDDYLVLDAKINGQSVYLAIDTGAEYPCLFSPTVKRLGLSVTAPRTPPILSPGTVPFNLSEECTLSIEGFDGQYKTRFAVVELPPTASSTSLGGVIGWYVLKDNIMQVDADKRRLRGLKKLPEDIGTWSKYPISHCQNFQVLLIKVSGTSEKEEVVLIDTGSPLGVSLNSRLWEDWSGKQKDSPFTLMSYYTPAVGLKVYKEYWADQLAIGSFTISGVPVANESIVFEQAIPGLVANFGLFALSRFDVIIDGPAGHFYVRQKENPTSKYKYNRAGAVFVPKDPQSIPLIAHVVKDGPAYQVGIRDGDLLIKIADLDVTKWQTDPNVLPLSRFWEQAAGTKLQLSLTRDDKPYTATVELKEIFPQGENTASEGKETLTEIEKGSKP